jgi:hypothetical protein
MPAARFETKAGSGSGAGYERWRSWEYRPSTERDGKEDVYVPHHRLLAIVECYSASTPLWAIFADLDGSDVHHENALKWDNRGENIEVVDHREHARRHASRASETATPDASGDLEVPADD